MKTRTIPHEEFSGRRRVLRGFTGVALAATLTLTAAGLLGNAFVHDMGVNVKGVFSGEFFNAPGVSVENRQEQASTTEDAYANLARIEKKPTVGKERLYYHKTKK